MGQKKETSLEERNRMRYIEAGRNHQGKMQSSREEKEEKLEYICVFYFSCEILTKPRLQRVIVQMMASILLMERCAKGLSLPIVEDERPNFPQTFRILCQGSLKHRE
eukprot:scaffold1381_cov64-Cylindrotheca_fusiformis.AAC.8